MLLHDIQHYLCKYKQTLVTSSSWSITITITIIIIIITSIYCFPSFNSKIPWTPGLSIMMVCINEY